MEIKIMAFREVYKLFVDAWGLYRKYSARRLDDAECEAMAQEAPPPTMLPGARRARCILP